MKFSLIYASTLLFLASLLFLANLSYDLYRFNQSVKKFDKVEAVRLSKSLSDDVDFVANLTKLPLVERIPILTQFSRNRKEIISLIKSVPYLSRKDRATRYLLVFQNVAEARGTGGILGAYAVFENSNNKIRLIDYGPNSKLASLSKIPIDLPKDYINLYGQNPAILQNSNLSPHFPYGARIWISLYERQMGVKLDGVIAVDPVAVSHLIHPLGSIEVEGSTITPRNLVSLTLKDAYQKYRKDNQARKLYLAKIIKEVGEGYSTEQFSRFKLATSILNSLDSRRVFIYLKDRDASRELINSHLSGTLKFNAKSEYRAVIQNIDASKLDYYLARIVSIRRITCEIDPEIQVRIDLKNTLTTSKAFKLPSYVLTRADKNRPDGLEIGSHRVKLFVYGPSESTIVGARAGMNTRIEGSASERGRPIVIADIELPPGKSGQVTVIFRQIGKDKIEYVDQPLVLPTKLKIMDSCSK